MRILPEGYTQLEYIESTGTQYIDTGIYPSVELKTRIKFKVNTSYNAVFGSAWTDNGYFLNVWGDDNSALGWQSGGALNYPGGYKAYEVNDVTVSTTEVVCNGVVTTVNYTSANTTTHQIRLFGVGSGENPNFNARMYLYTCEMYDNGALVRNYIPAESPDGAVGLYDAVNGAFNAGVGTFIAGPEFSYNEVEYIESSGTQYIDTGFMPKYNSQVVADVSGMAASPAFIFGTRNTASATASEQFSIYRTSSGIRSDYFGTNATQTIADASARTVIDKNSNIAVAFDFTITNTAVSSGECTYPLYLFALNNVGAVTLQASIKLYSCQIYDNGTLVRHYIPVIGTDGVAGLWDKVEKVFYGNAGTGAFTAGAIIPDEPEVSTRKVTVDLIPPMTGEKTEDFNINYYVADDIGTESFTVVEYIDDEETQSRTVTAGETISTFIESTGMDDGLHTFMLIVDETVEVEYTFYVNNSTTTIESTGVAIDLPAEVNINEKFLISVIVTELSFTIAKLKIHAGDIYSGEV